MYSFDTEGNSKKKEKSFAVIAKYELKEDLERGAEISVIRRVQVSTISQLSVNFTHLSYQFKKASFIG